MSSKSYKRQRLIAFLFVNTIQYPRTLNNNIYYSNKREPLLFFHSHTNTWPRSGPFYWQTHVLVVTVELVWLLFLNIYFFNFVPTLKKSLRFTRFKRSYVNRNAVVLTNHCQSYTAFLFDVLCLKCSRSFFLQLFVPSDSAFA